MTNDLVIYDIKPVTKEQDQKLRLTFQKLNALNEVSEIKADVKTNHFLHAGCYVRTCLIKKGEMIGSALIKIPTVVILCGCVSAYDGENRTTYQGYKILKGSAFRRAAWFALEDTYITMFFATQAKDVKEATQEFTDEWQDLLNAEE